MISVLLVVPSLPLFLPPAKNIRRKLGFLSGNGKGSISRFSFFLAGFLLLSAASLFPFSSWRAQTILLRTTLLLLKDDGCSFSKQGPLYLISLALGSTFSPSSFLHRTDYERCPPDSFPHFPGVGMVDAFSLHNSSPPFLGDRRLWYRNADQG